MELREGYKQTEVGVIPEDWELIKVKDLVEREYIDKPLDGNHGDIHPKKSDFVDVGIPFVMANDIKDGNIDFGNCSFITIKQANTLQKGFSVTGDVLLTHKGTVGRTTIVDKLSTPFIMLTPQVTYYRVINPEFLDNRYLRQYFDGYKFQTFLKNYSGGGTRAYIGIIKQADLPIVLPPSKTEQTAIANALSDADALIQSLTRLIAKKRQIKQGAMQTLLNPYENGSLKTGWVVKKLGDVTDIDPENLGGGVNPNYQFKYISLEDVDRGVLRTYSEQVFETAPSRARRVVKKGDVLIGTVRPNLQSHCLIVDDIKDLICSTGFAVVRCRDDITDPQYIFSLFFARFVEKQIQTLLTGSNYPAINSRDVRSLMVPLPKFSDQTRIATILSDMDTDIAALETKLAKTQQIKQGMMQNLLTGRIRLV
ncbi:MAG TPA: restriction endonuclease subunit S [Gammaproteobacteria bacterium]|nr:restriction endonuclease subunit S [Gammaproteobacteria bacterium]